METDIKLNNLYQLQTGKSDIIANLRWTLILKEIETIILEKSLGFYIFVEIISWNFKKQ